MSADIFALAQTRFGVRRHGHKRIVRTGPNTLLTYDEDSADLRIGADDVVFLDFGPVFDTWEADFGRTYALGADPRKHQLVRDFAAAFQSGKEFFQRTPQLTTGELYDFVAEFAGPGGWEFGASTAGHPIGHFPHERSSGHSRPLSIRHGNDLSLRELDGKGMAPLDPGNSFRRPDPEVWRLLRGVADLLKADASACLAKTSVKKMVERKGIE